MRILLAGTGSIGQRHLRNLVALDPAISFVMLRPNGREDAVSRSANASVVSSIDQALETQVDALVIATPSAFHSQLLLAAISAGLPTYVEKPVVITAVDVEAVRLACHRHGFRAATQVGCNLRWLPSLQRMHELVIAGTIGRVVRASFDAGQWLPDWRPHQDHRQSYSADPQRGGGVIFDLIHEIDAARWLLGNLNPLACCSASVAALEIGSEAVAAALLHSEAGALVQLALDYVARRPLRRYQLVGEAGTLCWDLPSQSLVIESAAGVQLIDCGYGGFDVGLTYSSAMADFLNAVQGRGMTLQPLEEGLLSAALAIQLKELACPNA